MIRSVLAGGAVTAVAVCAALLPAGPVEAPAPEDPPRASAPAAPVKPLSGRIVVLDPGHQLGNHNFPTQINRLVPSGGDRKACNTTGTATEAGFPEATLNFQVARLVRSRLERLGARVVMTRHTNREDRWGPCVDRRGRAGNELGADAKISIHADGSYGGGRGFHVIAPTDSRGRTHDIHPSSRRLALRTKAALQRHGVPVADYIAGGDGLDFRGDLGTLNLSDVPTIMVELGNMRSPADSRRMTTPKGRATYADALVGGAMRFFKR